MLAKERDGAGKKCGKYCCDYGGHYRPG